MIRRNLKVLAGALLVSAVILTGCSRSASSSAADTAAAEEKAEENKTAEQSTAAVSAVTDSTKETASAETQESTASEETPEETKSETVFSEETVPAETESETTASETIAPETTASAETESETTIPETAIPVETGSETPASETTAPAENTSETAAPETDAPAEDESGTAAPADNGSETPASETAAPAETEPETAASEITAPAVDYSPYAGHYTCGYDGTTMELTGDGSAFLSIFRLAELQGSISGEENGDLIIFFTDPNGETISSIFDVQQMVLLITDSSWSELPNDTTYYFGPVEETIDYHDYLDPETYGSSPDAYSGLYTSSYDGSSLTVYNDGCIEVSIVGVTSITGQIDTIENGVLMMTGTDGAGAPVTMSFQSSDRVLTIIDTTFELLSNGSTYTLDIYS